MNEITNNEIHGKEADQIRERMQSCYICNVRGSTDNPIQHVKGTLWICESCSEGTNGLVRKYPDLDPDFLKGHRERTLKELGIEDPEVRIVRCVRCDLTQTIDNTSGTIQLCVGCEADLIADMDRDRTLTQRGTKIRNGSTILEIAKIESDPQRWIVLCLWGDEFVTWNMDGDQGTHWGRYFRDLSEAVQDFKDRVQDARKGG